MLAIAVSNGLSLFQPIGNYHTTRIYYKDKRQRSPIQFRKVAKHADAWLKGYTNKRNCSPKEARFLKQIRATNLNIHLLFTETLTEATQYLRSCCNVRVALCNFVKWAYAHYPDFLLGRFISKAIISLHLKHASNSVCFLIVSFRLIVCQMLEDAYANTKQDVDRHAQMLFEYAQSHFPFVEHIMLGKPTSDSALEDFGHIISRCEEVSIRMSFVLDPMLYINDLSSNVPDLTLIMNVHDEWLQTTHSVSPEVKKQGIQRHTQSFATTCMLTLFRKSLGQRCQVRGLTKALQVIVKDNAIVANCVSQWLLHSLCMSNVRCFPRGQNILTRFFMHRTVNSLRDSKLNFANIFISYLPKSPFVQMFLVSVIRHVMIMYVDLDLCLNHKIYRHIGCVLEQMQTCKIICKFQSLFCVSIHHVCEELHSMSSAEICAKLATVAYQCMIQTFSIGTTRLHSISTKLNVHNSLWFQYCKDSLQKTILPHKEILDMPFTMIFEDYGMHENSIDFHVHKDHQNILFRILGFYSNVNMILSKINTTCVETIMKCICLVFEILHCSIELQSAICSCILQYPQCIAELADTAKRKKEEWKAWVIFVALDEATSLQIFDLNATALEGQMATAKHLFPSNSAKKMQQEYHFCTSCPSVNSIKHPCEQSECLHSAVSSQIHRPVGKLSQCCDKAMCMQSGKCKCMRWKRHVGTNHDSSKLDKTATAKFTSVLNSCLCMVTHLKTLVLFGKAIRVREITHMLCSACLAPIMFLSKPTLWGHMPVCRSCLDTFLHLQSYSNIDKCAYCMSDLSIKVGKSKSSKKYSFYKWVVDDTSHNMRLCRLSFCETHMLKNEWCKKYTKTGLLKQIHKKTQYTQCKTRLCK